VARAGNLLAASWHGLPHDVSAGQLHARKIDAAADHNF
jgi:hypothetical protein